MFIRTVYKFARQTLGARDRKTVPLRAHVQSKPNQIGVFTSRVFKRTKQALLVNSHLIYLTSWMENES